MRTLQQIPILIISTVLTTQVMLAQGGGPLQPEFIGSPVAPGPSVNTFTGDFTYGLPIITVPGPHGSSYRITLSYRAGTNPNAEVGWVGYGWSLNPGSIIREKRGFPDDWDGEVIYHNKMPYDYTISATTIGNIEFASIDGVSPGVGPVIDGTYTRRYNNRTGFGTIWSASTGAGLYGQYGGLHYTNDNGEGSFTPVLTPNLFAALGAILLSKNEGEGKGEGKGDEGKETNSSDPASEPSLFAKVLNSRTGRRILDNGRMPNLFASREFLLAPPAVVPLEGEIDNIGFGTDIMVGLGVVTGRNIGTRANASEIRPKPETSLRAYGYLLSDKAGADDLMDHSYEKDVPFSLKDNLLPIPFSNADVFRVSGGGSFRAFNRNAGTFHQNAVTSELDISTDIPNIIIGSGFGAGYRWGDGSTTYKSGGWDDPEAPARSLFRASGDEPWFFRFSHDRGGSLLYDNDDKAVKALLIERSGIVGIFLDALGINNYDRYAVPPNDIRLHLEEWERPGRNSYVGFTRNADMLLSEQNRPYKAYTNSTATINLVGDRDKMPGQIGEFALFGPGGSRYSYSLPVYASGERSLQLGLLYGPRSVDHYFRAYRWIDRTSAPTVIGQQMSKPYATSWLLTEITTPDYVDLTSDGPTDDDLGGWTTFHYKRLWGWEYWRQPYNGLSFNPVDLSDPEDDLGSYSDGLRERYLLERIETKTHVALFVLNNLRAAADRRKDGFLPDPPWWRGLSDRKYAGSREAGLPGPLSYGYQLLHPRYLQRIELYRKDADGEPDTLLSTIRFEYDYSLRKNMPNSLLQNETDRYGILTLRKVWIEEHNVKEATIRPIIFGYDYKKSEDYSADMVARYPEITSFADSLSDAMQNPDYNPYDFDAWGSYRPGGIARLDKRIPYLPQNDTSYWDPAAWQLKWIRSPSGGEIHIQYEEDDYAFVHDRPTLAMVSLIDEAGSGDVEQSKDQDDYNRYFLRLSDIGVDSTDLLQVKKVKELIQKEVDRNGRLLFRFLYALRGTKPSITRPEYNSAYIAGHAELSEVNYKTINAGTDNEWYALYVELIGKDDEDNPHSHGLPKKVCLDYAKKRKRGKLGKDDGITYSSKDLELVGRLFGKYFSFLGGDYCKEVDYANSYIRIPTLSAKKGGGLRVKRLLSYDPGIEGDSVLYGTEYRYELYDPERNEVISSGVATNEPTAIRDENPLVRFRERNDDEDFSDGKIAAGRDRARNERPIGESLLPGASIGYARVATHPIHQGATTTGFSVTDFYTHRDYPYDAYYNGIGPAVDHTDLRPNEFKTSPLFVNLLIYQQSEHLVFATQGFRFVKTDMPGKVRRRLANGGLYTPYERDWSTSASTENIYYQPGDSIPLLYRLGDSLRYGYPGKQMEVVHATRRNGSSIREFTAEGDAGFLFFSGAAYYAVSTSQLSTHATSKVVNYPAILKGVLSYADGNYNYTENVAFDPRSGSPIVTRSRDAFDGRLLNAETTEHAGTHHNYAIPLLNRYPELGSIAENERAVIGTTAGLVIQKGVNANGAYIDFPGGSETTWLKKLTAGDLIELTLVDPQGGDPDAGRYHVQAIEGSTVYLDSTYYFNELRDPAFARTGRVYVEVIHSGRQNSPGAALGTVTTYGETADEVAIGANISWSGGDASARLGLVSTLNALLAAGSGTIDATNVDSTLQLKHYTTGTCATLPGLGQSWTLSTNGDTVFIGMPGYTDTLVGQGLGGWFDLDDAGQIVYRSVGRLRQLKRLRVNPQEQRVLNFTFCGDDPALQTIDGVIAASAAQIGDTVDWHPVPGVESQPGLPNAFERGERGRWSPRTAYIYRTSVRDGSQAVAGERIYKDAGTFDDFSLFNWTEPRSNDRDHWIRLDSITHIDKHNVPYGSIDPLGRSTITLFDYGLEDDLLPVLSAWNAEKGTVAFESFESYDIRDFFEGHYPNLSDQKAHAGTKSIEIGEGDTSKYRMRITLNDHLLQKGGLLRFWSTNDSSKIHIQWGDSSRRELVPEKIVRVGEWTLYEGELRSDSLSTYYVAGDDISLWLHNTGDEDIWVDDLKFQPTDAIAGASVFDPLTFQPVAGFDDQLFGIYPVYDGRSRAYALVAETSRGLRTIGDVQAHVPGATRDWLGQGSPFGTGTSEQGSDSPTSIFNGNLDEHGQPGPARFDLLEIKAGLSHQHVKVFGVDPDKLRGILEEKAGEFDNLTPEQLSLLGDYKELTTRREELLKAKGEATDEATEQQIEAEIESLETRQHRILDKLGIEK